MRSAVSWQHSCGYCEYFLMFSWNFGSMSSKWITTSTCTPVISVLTQPFASHFSPFFEKKKSVGISILSGGPGLRREVRHLLGRRVWETTLITKRSGRIIIFCQKTIRTQWKNLKSQKFLCFDEISENLDPIWVESVSPLSRIHIDPSRWIYSGRLEIFPWNLVTSSNGMAMKQLYKGLFRYLDKLYGYVWIYMDKRYLRSNWIWYCKN